MIIEKQSLLESVLRLTKPQEDEKGVIVRRGVLLSKDGAFLVHYTDNLDTLYKMLDCETIDIVTRNVKGKPFDFVVDDEGRMKRNHVQAVSSDGNEWLLGNILIAGFCDENGDLTDIDDTDLGRIIQCLRVSTEKSPYWTAKAILVYEL